MNVEKGFFDTIQKKVWNFYTRFLCIICEHKNLMLKDW
jgi:hypothetical protein